VAAVMGIISMRAKSSDDAVEWARQSVKHNPRGYDDREFNLASGGARRQRAYRVNTPLPLTIKPLASDVGFFGFHHILLALNMSWA
jgi:hypothetical protein